MKTSDLFYTYDIKELYKATGCRSNYTDSELISGQLKEVDLQKLYAGAALLNRIKALNNPKRITGSKDIIEHLKPYFDISMSRECFFSIYLSRRNHIIAIENISVGGRSGTTADPKVIFEKALINKSSSLIIAHNHPSGNVNPSEADLMLTKKLKEVGQLLDMPLLDAIIIGWNNEDLNYFSFADEGII